MKARIEEAGKEAAMMPIEAKEVEVEVESESAGSVVRV